MIHAIRHFIWHIYPLIILFWIIFLLPYICLAAMWIIVGLRLIIEMSLAAIFYKIKRILRGKK